MKTVHVIITTYQRPEPLHDLLTDLYLSSAGYHLKVHIYSDGSDIESYTPTLLEFGDKFDLFYFEDDHDHKGKACYWELVNKAFVDAHLSDADYFLMLPDDDRLKGQFLERAISTWEDIEDPDKVCLTLGSHGNRIKNWTEYIRQERKAGNRLVWQTQWVDMKFLAKKRFFEELGLLDPIPKKRFKNPRKSSGVGKQISETLHARGLGMYQVTESLVISGQHPSKMNPLERKMNPNRDR